MELKNSLVKLKSIHVKESNSEWCPTMRPVRKPDGSSRWCVDYRCINKVDTCLRFQL